MIVNLSYMGLSTVELDVLKSEADSEDSTRVIDDDSDSDGGGGTKDLSAITGLDLSHNRVQDFDFLAHLPSLQTLILDHNHLGSHLRLPVLPNLHTLWANHNEVSNLAIFVASLRVACPGLNYLSLMNNPCAPSYLNGGSVKAYRDYRHFVIGKLETLTHLDDRPVSKIERTEAQKLYGALNL